MQYNPLIATDSNFNAQIILCARMNHGISQEQLAHKAGIPTDTINKIENGVIYPTVYDWQELTKALGISGDAVQSRFIDTLERSQLRSTHFENGFELSPELQENRCIKIRALLPYFAAIIDVEGWLPFTQWLERKNLSVPFLFKLDNQVNLRFYEALVDHLYELGILDTKVELVTTHATNRFLHGRLWDTYRDAPSSFSRIKAFVEASPFYQCAFELKVVDENPNEKNLLAIECKPAPFLFSHLETYKAEALAYLDLVREGTLLNLANSGPAFGNRDRSKWTLREVQSIYHGYETSIYIMKAS